MYDEMPYKKIKKDVKFMKKKYFLLICLTLFIISIAAVSASDIGQTDEDTDIMAVSNDDVLGDSVDSGTFSELQEKINNASEGSTIELLNNYTYDDTFQADGIMINKSLTIEGNGFTIDGANKARIFFINATHDITLNNIVFANGLSELGGAILFNQSITEVSISNSLFTNNSAPSNSAGGAINFNFDASYILFENTTFENNYAGYGGSITFDNNARFIQFDGCNFRTNKERESKIIGGGALYFIKDAGAVFIENCEFDNLTANTGGAMHFEGKFVLSMINNTKFTNNKAQTKNTAYGGGAISIEGNADFTGIFDSEFINNSATTHGGAIKIMGNTTTLGINNTVFDGNYAPYAGALCLKGAENLIISDSNFTNNKGTDEDIVGGGAIYIIGNLTESTIMNSKFENNSARTGGAIFVEGNLNTTTFNHNQFTNNSAFTNNTKYGGGAIAVEGNATNNNFEKTIFAFNTATTHGGAIKFMENDENNTFVDCIFIDNYAPYGGSIAVSNKSKKLNLTRCIFEMFKEPEEDIIGGGAIYFIDDLNGLYMTNCVFESFTARSGGAIYVEGDVNIALINKTAFINNKATTNNTYYGGGAIDVEGNAQLLIITESNFTNNSAQTHGGAIKLRGNNSYIGIAKSIFDGNYAPYAGAISLGNTQTLLISYSKFTNNKGTDEDIVGGGAIYVIGNLTKANIYETDFINNSARTGGAIFVEGIMDNSKFRETYFINNSAFTNNTKYGGGAIAVQGNATNNNFEKSIFMENTATTHGGAIKFMDNDENNTFNKCIFMDNYAPYGGSIAVSNSSQTLNITDCIFTNTKEPEKEIIGGGAIYFISDANELYITNSEFKALTARAGGAIYIEGDLNGTVIAETNFIDNKATTNNTYYGGGAIDVEGNAKDVVIIDSNFTNNSAQTHGGAIKLRGNNTNIVISSSFDGNYAPYAGAISLGTTESLYIFDSNFTNNKGTSADIIGGGAIYIIGNLTNARILETEFINNSARAGGAIFVEGIMDNSTFLKSFFQNNTAFTNNTKYGGGAIAVQGNATNNKFELSTFVKNTATTHGGAIKFMDNDENNTFQACMFANNYAPYGGAIATRNNSTSLNIINTRFISIPNRTELPFEVIGGGAIYFISDANQLYIKNTDFSNNTARAGGAIFVEGDLKNSEITGTQFLNNTATTNNTKYGGGAIAVQGNATNNKFNVLLFAANTGTTHGGAINFMGNAINNTFVDCEFLNNNAKYGSDIAVNKNTENLNFGQCNFKSSSEAAQEVIGGGALYFINNVTNINIDECNFTDYTARAGGAISFEKTVEKSVIQNTLFTNNTITTQNWNYGGGAIFIEDTASDLTIRNCEFINNTASTEGGAIFINNGEKVLIDGVTFSKNTAEDGRALYLKDGNNVTIQNSAFVNNTGFGAEIHYAGNIISSIINSTFDGTKHIVADETAILTLSNNKELNPYLDDDYFIYNEGALFLENNTLSNVIYNNGMIFSPTTMTTLLNETYNTTESFIYLNAYCEDDNGNSIVSDYGTFHINDNELKVFYDDNTLIGNTILPEHGSYLIYTTTYGLLYGCTQKYAIINYNPKKDIIINASDIELEIGQYGEIEVELSENATGTVTAVVDDEQYMAPVKDGKATIIIRPLEPGEYEAFIYYSGDNNYQSNHTTSVVTVLDKISVVAPDVTKYYHGPERLVVNVTQSGKAIANATVEITINGGTYTRQTDENGTVSLGLNLESGSYIATVKVDDIEVNTNVTILPTVNGTDVTKVFRNNTQYYATFRDSQGNYLKDGSNVRFNINGVMYDRKVSGDKGLAKLNINLQQGDYIITVMNLVTGENTANNITVIPRIIENNDITKYYRNGTQYTVKIIGDDGKPVGAGESVTFNINGVFYTRQTDANGTAKLNINLQPGDYIITAEYKGCMVSNNIKVLPVLTATDLVKKYGTMTPFEANLVDGQGKAYANQKIEFNINGIFYYRNTDNNGVAKLNINLMAGEYIITSTYNACSISNKVTIIL